MTGVQTCALPILDGTKVRTMNVTCLEHFYEACKVRAIEEGIPVSRVLRVALQLGVIRLETEYSKQLRGEDNKVDKIREMYAQDGRMKKSTETRKSKKIVREGDGRHWHYEKDVEDQ